MLRPELQEIVEEFSDLPREMRLELLLEFADALPPLPDRYLEDPSPLERVEECQTPLRLAVEIENDAVRLVFDAPPEAPTTRGYAAVLAAGLDGGAPEQLAQTPTDVYVQMGLDEVITPLRLRGMTAILVRARRLLAAAQAGAD